MRQVFTHTSWAPDRVHSYERLEFLGDSVLSLCITTELYRRFPDFAEGHLARLRAYIVSRATCSRVATKLGLGKLLRQYAGARRGERRRGPAADQPERPRRPHRVAHRRRLRHLRLRGRPPGGGRGVRGAHRVRREQLHRPQDRAAGVPGAQRPVGGVQGARLQRAAAQPRVRDRGRRGRRRRWAAGSAPARSAPSRRPRPRRCTSCSRGPGGPPAGRASGAAARGARRARTRPAGAKPRRPARSGRRRR